MYKSELREQNIKNVRKQVIDCALQFGVKNTDFELVAKKTGLTERTVRRYYSSKDEMFLDAIENHVVHIYERMCKEIRDEIDRNQTGIVQLQQFLTVLGNVQVYDAPPWHMVYQFDNFIYETGILKEKDNELWKLREIKKILIGIVETGKKDGSITTQRETELLCEYIINSYVGLLVRLSQFQYLEDKCDKETLKVQLELYTENLMLEMKRNIMKMQNSAKKDLSIQ